jgi:hypothetical protein
MPNGGDSGSDGEMPNGGDSGSDGDFIPGAETAETPDEGDDQGEGNQNSESESSLDLDHIPPQKKTLTLGMKPFKQQNSPAVTPDSRNRQVAQDKAQTTLAESSPPPKQDPAQDKGKTTLAESSPPPKQDVLSLMRAPGEWNEKVLRALDKLLLTTTCQALLEAPTVHRRLMCTAWWDGKQSLRLCKGEVACDQRWFAHLSSAYSHMRTLRQQGSCISTNAQFEVHMCTCTL